MKFELSIHEVLIKLTTWFNKI